MPITFRIPAEVDWFTKLNTIKLYGEYSVKNESKDAPPAQTEVWSLINNPVHSMFAAVNAKINDHEIADR